MPSLTSYKALQFDVYGTLIDWESGLHTALLPLLSSAPPSRTKGWGKKEILEAYASIEKDLQVREPQMLYTELMGRVWEEMARRLGVDVSRFVVGEQGEGVVGGNEKGEGTSRGPTTSSTSSTSTSTTTTSKPPLSAPALKFAHSIRTWPPFPDTVQALQRLSKHYKLAILSNVDRDSLVYTLALLQPPSSPSLQQAPTSTHPFSQVLTSQETSSYKPSLSTFSHSLSSLQSKFGIEKEEVCVVTCSLFHDIEPAGKLGLGRVWIDRGGVIGGVGGEGQGEVEWDWKFGSLGEFVEVVEEVFRVEGK
ncbi:hypothetical protein JAAARDRAFT_34515 [Jaapia argillacea MUCL 33604]|uniref:HAD-like protein n=1 Tax=Jaapia argillacea MUCL 33604 TaxID=933084 RepID=A0A067PXR7_9AGAM|nr:hypothetical protein JAAARDRAFT_34515 [Jaapia argillacea MUCL 33604]